MSTRILIPNQFCIPPHDKTSRAPPGTDLMCSNPNRPDIGNFYGHRIHTGHPNQTGSLPHKNPNRNPPTNNLHPLIAFIAPTRPIFSTILPGCIQLPGSSALGLWSYDVGNSGLHADAPGGRDGLQCRRFSGIEEDLGWSTRRRGTCRDPYWGVLWWGDSLDRDDSRGIRKVHPSKFEADWGKSIDIDVSICE
jgi:hypothetical protein